MTDKSRTLTLRQYGTLRGVSAEAVRKAIKTGRLKKSISYDEKGWPRVDPILAEKEWPPGRDTGLPIPENPPEIHYDPDGEIPEPTLDVEGSPTASMAKSRAIREAFEAKLKKLDWETKSGKLVEADAVKTEAFKMARLTRDAMLAIPDRLAAEIAAETDVFKVHTRITEEIRKALEGLGDG